MGRHAPADHFVDDDPTVFIHYGDDEYGGAQPDPDDPIPGWRKPIALVGWVGLIAVLIALIVWGIIQLAQGAPPQQPVTGTTTAPRPSATSSVVPVAPREQTTTPTTDAPTASTEDTLPSTGTTTPTTPSGEAYPLPQLPSVITLPPLPGLPTEITLPPGL
ncbi:hypothetical protein [Mycobacterium genavense]|uniref:hypothetical protein n=1 Tax=Mycobacterium genavense TaxID=36812 RepID=UPI0004724853|nr:hypothetical protein [Mycobacterium genavense]